MYKRLVDPSLLGDNSKMKRFVLLWLWSLSVQLLPFAMWGQPDPCALDFDLIETPNSPGLLIGWASAYDDRRQAAVMFGGHNPLTRVHQTSNTWEWNGAVWTLRTAGTPPARKEATMAYDSARGVCVLFGGGTNTFAHEIPFNDTWEWDGFAWILRKGNDPSATDRPPPMDYPKMSYDSRRRRMVLIGSTERVGDDVNPVTRTWEWDGNNWSVRASAPPARSDTAMAYDSVRRVTVLFGGNGDSLLNDTWTWDGTNWTRVAVGGPQPRYGHGMAFDVRRKVMLMCGGRTSQTVGGVNEVSDVWEWNGQTWTELPAYRLVPRRLHQIWYDSGEEAVFVFGGTYSARHLDGSFSHYILEDLKVARPPGLWIDFSNPSPGNGSFDNPYNTVAAAVDRASSGCILHLQPGSSSETLTISKNLTLRAYNGPVTIGR